MIIRYLYAFFNGLSFKKTSSWAIFPIIMTCLFLPRCKTVNNNPETGFRALEAGMISVEGRRFTDSIGRQVIFNGINYVNKDPGQNYIFQSTVTDFREFKNWGFNCIRLGVIWDGVEPEPGIFDEAYLDKIEEQIEIAKKEGLYVILDMHQDLFSVLYSDGAPEWATLNEGSAHEKGSVWSDAYFLSPSVQKSFDNFWANKPASDGTGIQDHYANMWKHVAQRLAGHTNVVGYDIMNEPFNGSGGLMIMPILLKSYATLYAEESGKVLSEKELYDIWGNVESRFEALNWMSDIERYSKVISSATEHNQAFEKNELASFYQKVADRIREADTTRILFLEHAYFSNAGVQSGIEPVKDKNGNPDRLVAYAAHGYDLLVDTKYYGNSSNERVEYIFSRVNNVAERINRPVVIGEWGAFSGNSEEIASMAQSIMNIFEKFQFSQTYWAYHQGFDKDLYFIRAFFRPFARYINGILLKSEYNYQTGEYLCSWEEAGEIKAGTVIFIPELKNLVKEDIRLEPENSNVVVQALEGSNGGFVIVPPAGSKKERSISFRLRPETGSFPLSINKSNK